MDERTVSQYPRRLSFDVGETEIRQEFVGRLRLCVTPDLREEVVCRLRFRVDRHDVVEVVRLRSRRQKVRDEVGVGGLSLRAERFLLGRRDVAANVDGRHDIGGIQQILVGKTSTLVSASGFEAYDV